MQNSLPLTQASVIKLTFKFNYNTLFICILTENFKPHLFRNELYIFHLDRDSFLI